MYEVGEALISRAVQRQYIWQSTCDAEVDWREVFLRKMVKKV